MYSRNGRTRSFVKSAADDRLTPTSGKPLSYMTYTLLPFAARPSQKGHVDDNARFIDLHCAVVDNLF